MFDRLIQRALDAAARSDLNAVIDLLVKARREASDDFDRAHVDDLIAHFLVRLHREVEAVERLDLAALGYGTAGVRRLAATSRETQGDVLVGLRRLDEATVAYTKAVALYRSDRLSGAAAGCAQKLAELLAATGRPIEAAARIDDAQTIYLDHGWHDRVLDLDELARTIKEQQSSTLPVGGPDADRDHAR